MSKVVSAVVGKGRVGPPSGTQEGPMSSRVRAPQPSNEGSRGEVSGCNVWLVLMCRTQRGAGCEVMGLWLFPLKPLKYFAGGEVGVRGVLFRGFHSMCVVCN